MYDLAMTIYFGMYGATMTTNSELFWGPDSIMMLPARRCVESNFGRPMPSARRCPCSRVGPMAWSSRLPHSLLNFHTVHERGRGRAERLLPAHDGPRLRHHVARLRQARGLEGRLDQADHGLPCRLDSDLLPQLREHGRLRLHALGLVPRGRGVEEGAFVSFGASFGAASMASPRFRSQSKSPSTSRSPPGATRR